jgi:hypothetical protein
MKHTLINLGTVNFKLQQLFCISMKEQMTALLLVELGGSEIAVLGENRQVL